ncbi:Nodulation protein S (NodS) [Loktanella fryxellensis]|uniref:Nodulation protein S (NodS) n=1 Tax=Loktanella fryxellensis TaxID=245187 RepID=A0A1H8H9V4_9RHOB|nr:SAM-dependent methyltransferase [Loktanella fryxellensis]SEN52804.1 Nodulation protein S (NodS) [Loktanella fryxellensis]
MTDVLTHLTALYAQTDDPWNFDHSPYEQGKFAATRAALTRPHYPTALEVGCGNGALAQHLAPLCDAYVGMDAIDRAVVAARNRVPGATFVTGVYPCALPITRPDLVVLSEVLYFLTPDTIARLAGDLVAQAPGAEVVCVTYLGDTAQALQGHAALDLFRTAAAPALRLREVAATALYRIDRGTVGGDPA